VGTIGYTFLPVVLELWDDEPPLDVDVWDHVVEASLDVSSGRLGLHDIGGAGEDDDTIEVAPGTYRVRASAAGLHEATELDGGDRYRIQLWPSEMGEPVVVRWWGPWDPSTAVARPTAAGARVLVGAEAHDARVRMSWLASHGTEHLFRDDQGALWEHSTLADASGTPQLEELGEDEAVRRYGPKDGWGAGLSAPSAAGMLRNIAQTLRHHRGRRPRKR
jgi:hypothetical protein